MKKIVAIMIAAALTCAMCVPAAAQAQGSETPEIPDIFSVSYGEAFDGPEAQVVDGEIYVSDANVGASAIYVSGMEQTFDRIFAYGTGTATADDLSAERSNQYGYCATILANGSGTVVTLNDPVVVSDPESYANGVFAAAMSKVIVNGGQIYTNNPQGHGVDATYMGRIYLDGTVIHTAGSSSGSLATDYGGGFIQASNIDCTTELAGSPGIYCAGSSIILCKDSSFWANGCEGVMSAHDHGITVLDNCQVTGTIGLNGHQAMPSAAMSTGSYCFVFGGSVEATEGPLINEENGRTETFLVGTQLIKDQEDAYAIQVQDDNAGILTVNVWDTQIDGNVYCSEESALTINLYEGAKLTGEVEGAGEVIINVYDGGEYEGSFAAAEAGAGEAAPEIGDFDYYLVNYWAAGMQKWQGSAITTYIDTVQPVIIENSAAAFAEEGAAETAYDPAITDISEGGIDPALLDTSSASGFGEPGESGDSEGGSEGASEGESAEGAESGAEPAE